MNGMRLEAVLCVFCEEAYNSTKQSSNLRYFTSHVGDLSIHGRIILKRILGSWGVDGILSGGRWFE
jgi:hypothetical protein